MAQGFNLNVYQKSIESIVSLGHTVLQIFPFQNSPTAFYYVVNSFNPSMKTPTDDIQYNQAVGINITDFIEQNSYINKVEFERKFEAFIMSNDVLVTRIEFPNILTWFKFGMAR